MTDTSVITDEPCAVVSNPSVTATKYNTFTLPCPTYQIFISPRVPPAPSPTPYNIYA